MKFLHISDLHLGKSIDNFSLIDDQKYILNQIVDIVTQNDIQAILVAGDIYHRSIPPTSATKLLDDFLKTFSDLNIPLYIVSGNHDSVERLSFGSDIFKYKNIFITHPYDGTIQKEVICDEFGEINIYLMPFVNLVDIKSKYNFSSDSNVSTLNNAFKIILEDANVDTSKRNIFVGHQYVTATNQDREFFREYLGGTQNIDAHIFGNLFDYTALGHIHRPYWILKNKVRYCGSPLQYSTDECNNKNSVTILDFKSKGDITFKEVILNPIRKIRCIKGLFKDIIDTASNPQDYVEITLTDESYIENVISKLREVYPNVLHVYFDNSRTKTLTNFKSSADRVEEKSILELFSDFYNSIYEVKLEENPDYVEILNEVFNEFQKNIK